MSSLLLAARGTESTRQAQLALMFFAAVLAGALPLLLVLGHYRWFIVDEWGFLVQSDGGDIRSLLRPASEHWSTLPTLAFRGLWRLVGIRSYVPYQALVVMLHLTTAALLRIVMRRAGVCPWISTAAAAVFVLFGTGQQGILLAAQIGFDGSLVFGLLHLLLADHAGPVNRRDWLGLCAGVLGLLCSGVAVTMTVVVGLTVLIRRGWRVALLHTAPGGLLYAVWWFTMARNDPWVRASRGIARTPGDLLRFVANGAEAAFDGIGQVRGVGLALAVVVGIGLTLLWLPRPYGARRLPDAVAPTALLIGALVFLVMSGLGRAGSAAGPDAARTSRYVYVTAALALPAVALTADAVARRWRWAGPIVLVLLIIGVPGNVKAFVDARDRDEAAHQQMRRLVLSLPRVPGAKEVPGWVHPDWGGPAWPITMNWLRDGVASGRIPDPGPIDPGTEADLERRLKLQSYKQAIGRALKKNDR
ncbi:MAG: hypothetical protein ACJ73V_01985 [Acidimicrobiia bacterium]